MSNSTTQTRTEIPVATTQPQPIQGDSTTTIIIAIASLIQTTLIATAVLVKATNR